MNLFEQDDEIIRTLGFYQPFGSLMLHGKIETRWARVDRKLSFPLGKYLFYTTKKSCDSAQLWEWSGSDIINRINSILLDEPTKNLTGWAIGIGELTSTRLMNREDEENCFVLYASTDFRKDKNEVYHEYHQFCLHFENVKRIMPFEFKFGKQGVGILPESERPKINLVISQ